MTDFLDDPVGVAEDLQKETELAQHYVSAFVHNPSGKALLELWTKTLMNKRVSTNAPHTEYAATEAVRAFVAGIHGQIELAQSRQ